MKTPLTCLVLAALCAPAFAQSAESPTAARSTQGGGVAMPPDLFSCKRVSRDVAVTFGETTELKDLVTWAMGFTCKNFMIDPRTVSTGKRIHIIAPAKLSPAKAYELFLAALGLMNLDVVPKGNIYRIVDARPPQPMVMPAIVNGSTRPQQQVPTLEFEVVKR